MDFAFSDRARALFERCRALGNEASCLDPQQRLASLADGGVLGLCLPETYGGAGASFVEAAHAFEGLGATLDDGGLMLAAGAHLFGVASTLAAVGEEKLKQEWIPRLASGACLATVAATEEAAGSDVAKVAAIAEPTDGGYLLSGRKRYVTMADRAGLFLVVARDGSEGRGLTTLLVPGSLPGITIGAPLPTAGLTGARLAPVSFDRVEVPDALRLGRQGAGLAVFQVAMTYERALILAFRLGAMATQLGDAVRFARKREVGGRKVATFQTASQRVARMRLRLETARLLTYRAAWELDAGRRGQDLAALAKWHVAESAVASAFDYVTLLGGTGFLTSSTAMSTLDDTLGGTIHSGTADVLAEIVARWQGL